MVTEVIPRISARLCRIRPKTSNNKTWNRKSNDSNKELNALVDKKVAAKMKALSGKKRKSKNKANVVEKLDDDLAGFNYDDMDNLHFDSDDSISV